MRNSKELLAPILNQANHFVIHLPDFLLKQHEKKSRDTHPMVAS